MNINTLTIYCDGNEVAVNVGPSDAPQLFEAFKAWQATPQRSSQESEAWQNVLTIAAEYLSETGDFMDADGMEVSDVTWN